MTISKNKVVHIHYTLKNPEGQVLDSSEGTNPLAYIQGFGNIIPGLEQALEGKNVGDKVNAVIPPEEAYGVKNQELVQEIPMTSFQEPSQVQEGAQFQVQTPQGTQIVKVVKVENDQVTIDMNHPLVDTTLHFDVEVVEIRDASEEELSHGHVHGPGGHDH